MFISLTGSIKLVRLFLIDKADCLTHYRIWFSFALVRPNAQSVPLMRLSVEPGSGFTALCEDVDVCV